MKMSYMAFSGGTRMKIHSIRKVVHTEPKQFYDVVNANPYNNFLVKTNSGYVTSHNCFFDEISFIKNQDIDKQKAKAKDMIDTAIGGMFTRFIHNGKNPTMLVVASSKRSEQSFMEEYIKTLSKTEGNSTMVVDKPVWEVKPKGTYSDETFYIGLGNKFLESIVIPDEDYDKLDLYKDRGYQIIEAPVDFKSKFIEDIDRNLCDFAGVSSSSSNKYMSGRVVSDAINPEFKNPFPDILEIGNGEEDTAQYYNFFDMTRIPKELLYKPLYVHLDMSVTGDMTGIAGVWIIGKKVSTDDQPAKDLSFRLAFSVSIKAPKGHQVSFEKNRKFIRWLKEVGFNVKGITSDTYQSYDLQQQLKAEGYNCEMLSVDRVTDGVCQPYQYLRSAIYEKRFHMYKSNRLFDEFVDIERNNNTGKIDHSPNCFTGDTKIRLVDGRSISIEELLREHLTGKQNYVYSINHTENKIEPKVIKNVWKTKDVTKLLKITLDNGEVIKCTPEHPFMLRNGSYILAKDIIPNDSLMPLYTKVSEKGLPGYRLLYDPFDNGWHYEHRVFAQEIDDTKFLVHHKNCNKLDNTPPNLIWMSKEKHVLVHSNDGTGAFSPEANGKRSLGVKQWHENNKDTDKYKLRNIRLRDSNRANYPDSKAAKHREYIKDIESYFDINYDDLTTSERAHYASMWLRLTNPDYPENHKKMLMEKHAQGAYINAKNALNKCNEKSKMLRKMFPNLDKSKFVELFGFEYDSLESTQKPVWTNRYRQKLYELLNHKVVTVETINVPLTPVYDIEVEDNHNFALDAGVFVHNCHKDALDAVCGATFNASKHAEEYAYDYGESLELTTTVNKDASYDSNLQQIAIDFEQEMQKLLDPVQTALASTTDTKTKTVDPQGIDFGMGSAQPLSYIADGIIVW